MNKIVVGLTGPMGSGKTVVAAVFCDNGYKLIDADVLARKVVEKGSPTLHKLSDRFGSDVINLDGTLNRTLLAQRAFSSKDNTNDLNAITHPAILALVKENIKIYLENGYTKIIYDAPLLFESGSDEFCDKIVSVIADKDYRISRVKSRDNMSYSDIEKRISAQHADSYYTDKSDYVIFNNSSYEKLIENTLKVIAMIEEVHDGSL